MKEGESKLTQKISYTSKALNKTPAVRNESSRRSCNVAVLSERAMILERMYGRPRGM